MVRRGHTRRGRGRSGLPLGPLDDVREQVLGAARAYLAVEPAIGTFPNQSPD